jgi:hypothetical protein
MAKQMDWENYFKPPKKQTAEYDPTKQAAGIEKRIEGAGLDVKKAADPRNFVERVLNLKPNQNVVFDLFELINRPQQAIFGAIDAAQKGENALKGAIEGIAGNKETRFKQILLNDPNLRYQLPDRTGGKGFENLDLVDVLGFIGDVLLDPVDWAFLPVKGAGALIKGIKSTANAIDNISDAARATDAAFDFLKANGKLKINKVEDLANLLSRTKLTPANYLRKVADSVNVLQTPLGAAFKGGKKAATAATNFVDKRFVDFLDYVDNARLANPNYADYTTEALAKLKLSYKYKGLKDLFKSTFDSAKSLPGDLLRSAYTTLGKKALVERQSVILYQDYVTFLKKAVKENNLAEDLIDRYAMVATELPYMSKTSLGHVFSNAPSGTQGRRYFVDNDTFNRMMDVVRANMPGRVSGSEYLTRLASEGTVGNVSGKFLDPDLMKELTDELTRFYKNLPANEAAIQEKIFKTAVNRLTRQKSRDAMAQESLLNIPYRVGLPNTRLDVPLMRPGASEEITSSIRAGIIPGPTDISFKPVEALKGGIFPDIEMPSSLNYLGRPISAADYNKRVTDLSTKVSVSRSKLEDLVQNIKDTGTELKADVPVSTVTKGKHREKALDALKKAVGEDSPIYKQLQAFTVTPNKVNKKGVQTINVETYMEITETAKELVKQQALYEKATSFVPLPPRPKVPGVTTTESGRYLTPEEVASIKRQRQVLKGRAKGTEKRTAEQLAKEIAQKEARIANTIPNYSIKAPAGYTKYYTTGDATYVDMFLKRGGKKNEPFVWTLSVPKDRAANDNVIAIFVPKDFPMEKLPDGGFKPLQDISSDAIAFVDNKLFGATFENDVAALWRSGKFASKEKLLETLALNYPAADVLKNKKLKEFIKKLPTERPVKSLQEMIDENPLKFRTQEDYNNYVNKTLFDRSNYFSNAELEDVKRMQEMPWFRELVEKGQKVRDDTVKNAQQLYSTNFGANIPEGYARHTLTDSFKQNRGKELYGGYMRSNLAGNIHAFDSREYAMSAVEANRMRGAQLEDAVRRGIYTAEEAAEFKKLGLDKMFETELSKSLSDFITMAPETTSRTKMLQDVVMKTTIADPALVRGLQSGEKFPGTMKKVTKEDLKNKLQGFGRYMKDEKSLKEVLNMLDAMPSNLAIENNLYDLIGLVGSNTEANAFVQIIDAYNNLFKGTKLLTPGFQLKNFIGNLTNILMSGIAPTKFFSESETAYRALARGDDLLRKSTLQGLESLTPDERELLKYFEGFLASGFQNNSKKLYDIESVEKFIKGVPEAKRGPIRQLLEMNSNANQAVDAQFRMNAYIYGLKNPESYMKLGLDTPEDFVRHVLFDPNDLSHYERTIIRKLIPFYTFAKKNLVYHMKNIGDNPQAYNRLTKTLDGMWRLLDLDPNLDVDTYKRDNMWIPVYRFKDGKYVAVKTNLPPSELGEFLSNPMQKVLSAASPLIRGPFELATNKQIFTGLPIQDFKGQRAYALDFKIPGTNIGLDRRTEYLIGQTGVDVPINLAYGTGKSVFDLVTKKATPAEAFTQGFGRSVASIGDPARTARGQGFDKLTRLREYVSYLKQEGVDLPTINQLENKNKNNFYSTLINQLSKYK